MKGVKKKKFVCVHFNTWNITPHDGSKWRTVIYTSALVFSSFGERKTTTFPALVDSAHTHTHTHQDPSAPMCGASRMQMRIQLK